MVEMLESSLSYQLEGRHLAEATEAMTQTQLPEIQKFWIQLQTLLKSMLSTAISSNSSKSSTASQNMTINCTSNIGKLKELYRISLKSASFNQLHAIYNLWAPNSCT